VFINVINQPLHGGHHLAAYPYPMVPWIPRLGDPLAKLLSQGPDRHVPGVLPPMLAPKQSQIPGLKKRESQVSQGYCQDERT
jgi:hypothetical protein